MSAFSVTELIDQRELIVHCRLCGWTGSRTLQWLSVKRDMECPACASVIVLNTSELRRSAGAVRRQVTALHRQLVDSIPAPANVMRPDSRASADSGIRALPKFALCQVYSEASGRQLNVSRAARKSRR